MNKIQNKSDLKKITAEEIDIIEIYLKYNRKNKHKMKPIPICKIPKKLF